MATDWFRVGLPRLEIGVYFLVWIAHSVAAWLLVLKASLRYQYDDYGYFFPRGHFPLSRFGIDDSDFEWHHWIQKLPLWTVAFVVHAVCFATVPRLIKEQRTYKRTLLLVSLFLNVLLYGWQAVACGIAFMCVMLLPVLLRRSWLVWILDIVLLFVLTSHWTPTGLDEDQSYAFWLYLAYKLLQCTSFCLEKTDHDLHESSKELISQLMSYSLYLPYSTTLIVTFKSFEEQVRTRHAVKQEYGNVFFLACRIAFWTLVNHVILHFFFMHYIISDQRTLEQLDLPTLAAVGYTVGQFFHMKYVCIFGFNVVFAQLDGMRPPWPPICISRVALYSRMWRYFDRGLYSFLRHHLYLRFAGVGRSYNKLKRLFAAVVCFGFVWIWHGASIAFFCWCAMNLVELLIEHVARELDRAFHVLERLSIAIGPRNVRRLLALLFVPCETLGIFAIFYFLGSLEAGHTFVHRLIVDQHYHLQVAYLYLIALGYAFAHCCMELSKVNERN